MTTPVWTAADEAEQAVIVQAFLDGFETHRGVCPVCTSGGPWCAGAREALDALLDWRRRRLLLSRAEWLRRQHDELSLILDGREAA